ncbi:hypothetical protein B0H15DRAFT_787654 [Mycena belliarum]|uniref:Alpha-type protein kinase domain-containing protein n=1 Tax=Mycena belliarum TaxID=1033014 RepID=A0AAD6TXG1_9AGAR|nr:hypothetical protein B0H15DRAFT_787654 [Mycena belliae]
MPLQTPHVSGFDHGHRGSGASQAGRHPGGPQIYTPAHHSLASAPLFPKISSLTTNPGYTEAHAQYEQMRNHFQNKCYSGGNTQTIIVRCWLARMEGRKQKETTIHDIYKAVEYIPVNVGAADLKEIVFYALLPQIITWLRGYDLAKIEFTLRKQHWIEVTPKGFPDVNAIADDFFTLKAGKTGGTVKIFNNKNPAKLFLGIDNSTYNAILEHFERLDNADVELMSDIIPQDNGPGVNTRPDRTPSPDPKRQKTVSSAVDTSPEASTIKKALRLQVAPRARALKGLFDNVSRDFLIHILPSITWAEVIENPNRFSNLTLIAPRHEVIYYNVKTKPLFGGFKSAIPGRVAQPIFDSGTFDVCLKQGFHINDEKEKVLYDRISQAIFLGGELNLLGWGTTMMNMVYKYMEGREKSVGKPVFEVPKMRFVHAGLAIAQTEARDTFMVEEWIDPECEGEFVKYIHNSSGQPRRFNNAKYDSRAQFLSFCQHVQYFKTDKAAYISDFQGGLNLLTDPQIISDPYFFFRICCQCTDIYST